MRVFECILMRVAACYHMYVATNILVGACVHDITCESTLMCIFYISVSICMNFGACFLVHVF